jgi:hypothetical protein
MSDGERRAIANLACRWAEGLLEGLLREQQSRSARLLGAPNHHPIERESRLLPLMVQSICRTELHEQCIVRPLPALLDASLRRFPLAFGFVLEMHSLLHRMAARWRLRYAAYFLVVSAEEMAERLVPNTRTHSYMRDMRNFFERYPWATILDLEMYRDAWLAGAEWGSRTYTQAQGASLNQA